MFHAAPNRKKTAAERRQQRLRAELRHAQWFCRAVKSVAAHRGNVPSREANAVSEHLGFNMGQDSSTRTSVVVHELRHDVTFPSTSGPPGIAYGTRMNADYSENAEIQEEAISGGLGDTSHRVQYHELQVRGMWEPLPESLDEDVVFCKKLVLCKYEFRRTRVNVAIQTHITGDIAARSFVEQLDARYRTAIGEQLVPLQQELTTLRDRVAVLDHPG